MGIARAAAGLGGAEGDRLVDPEAAAAQPESRDRAEQEGFKKKSPRVVAEEARPSRRRRRGLRDRRTPARPETGRAPRLGAGRRAPSRTGITASNGSTSRPSSPPPPANASGIFPTASQSPSSRPCWRHFAQEAGAGRDRIIVLVLDNAGWHGEAISRFPTESAFSFSLPTPRASARRTPLEVVDEPIINQHIPTSKRSRPSSPSVRSTSDDRQTLKGRAGFHWWPQSPMRANHPETV